MTKTIDYLHLYFDEGSEAAEDVKEGAAPAGDNKGADKVTDPASKGSGERDEKKYSDADLDKIIEKKFAKWQKQQAAAVDEAAKLASMNAQERAEHERDKLQKELDALKHANTIAEMEKTARGILQADGINISDAIISRLIADDAEATSSNVKAFAKAYKADVQNGVKQALTHKAPASSSGAGTLTKEDILKEKDPQKRQKLIRENLALFR